MYSTKLLSGSVALLFIMLHATACVSPNIHIPLMPASQNDGSNNKTQPQLLAVDNKAEIIDDTNVFDRETQLSSLSTLENNIIDKQSKASSTSTKKT